MIFYDHLQKSIDDLTSRVCLEKKHASLTEILALLQNADDQEIKSFQETTYSLNQLSKTLIENAFVKELRTAQDGDYEETDFLGVSEIAETVLKCIRILLPYLQMDSQILASILMLCATHGQDYFWSSQESVELAAEVIEGICEVHSVSVIDELLTKTSRSVFEVVLERLKPAIENDTWKKNPSTMCIFKWFLLKVEHPRLSPFFSRVLTPSLRLIDDYRCQNKINGIECVDHIVKNVPQAELLAYGRSDVIYDALFRITFERETELVEAIYPCMLSFLKSAENNLNSSAKPTKFCRYDAVYNNILLNMAHEQKLALRRSYSLQLPHYIDSFGIGVCRHLKRTCLVLCEYLITYDSPSEETRLNIIEALNCLITAAWPRLANHYEEILKSLLHLSYDIVMNPREGTSQKVKLEVVSKIKECLLNLRIAHEKTFMSLMSDILELEVTLPVVGIVREVIEDHR